MAEAEVTAGGAGRVRRLGRTASASGSFVQLQIDHIVFRTVINSYELSQVWTNPDLVPLAAGHRPLVIAIEPRTISGRELRF